MAAVVLEQKDHLLRNVSTVATGNSSVSAAQIAGYSTTVMAGGGGALSTGIVVATGAAGGAGAGADHSNRASPMHYSRRVALATSPSSRYDNLNARRRPSVAAGAGAGAGDIAPAPLALGVAGFAFGESAAASSAASASGNYSYRYITPDPPTTATAATTALHEATQPLLVRGVTPSRKSSVDVNDSASGAPVAASALARSLSSAGRTSPHLPHPHPSKETIEAEARRFVASNSGLTIVGHGGHGATIAGARPGHRVSKSEQLLEEEEIERMVNPGREAASLMNPGHHGAASAAAPPGFKRALSSLPLHPPIPVTHTPVSPAVHLTPAALEPISPNQPSTEKLTHGPSSSP